MSTVLALFGGVCGWLHDAGSGRDCDGDAAQRTGGGGGANVKGRGAVTSLLSYCGSEKQEIPIPRLFVLLQ